MEEEGDSDCLKGQDQEKKCVCVCACACVMCLVYWIVMFPDIGCTTGSGNRTAVPQWRGEHIWRCAFQKFCSCYSTQVWALAWEGPHCFSTSHTLPISAWVSPKATCIFPVLHSKYSVPVINQTRHLFTTTFTGHK